MLRRCIASSTDAARAMGSPCPAGARLAVLIIMSVSSRRAVRFVVFEFFVAVKVERLIKSVGTNKGRSLVLDLSLFVLVGGFCFFEDGDEMFSLAQYVRTTSCDHKK